MVLAAAQVCEDKKGSDIRILELDPIDSGLSDFFLIASGSNTRQTGAIADDIELRLKREFGAYARSVEGRRKGDWILLDYTDFVVHLFTPETREFYDIERLRKSARAVDTADLAAALREKTATVRKRAAKPVEAAGRSKSTAPAAKKTAKKSPAKKTATCKSAAKSAAAKKSSALRPRTGTRARVTKRAQES